MNEEQTASLVLGEAESVLLAEVLEQEQRELATEIRHTDSRAYKAQLQQRYETLDRLLAQFRAPSGAE